MLPVLFVFCALFFSEVTSWTVDLDEVKNYLVENEVGSLENVDNINNTENNTLDENYASDFDYQSYKEKEVTSIIRNGSVYLEGLSKALLSYRYTLSNCSNTSTTSPEHSKEQRNEIMSVCKTAANNSEYVQKLSELALLTTNQLRDKVYEKTYQDDEMKENELLLQLAWLLDKLAHLTGYEPDPKQYIDTDSPTTTEINDKQKNTTETIEEPLEILEQTENGRPMPKLPPKNMTAVKRIQKRSIEPLKNVVNYYIKYKVWNGSNSMNNLNNNIENFDVQNELSVKPISKRSVKEKFNIRRVKNKIKFFN